MHIIELGKVKHFFIKLKILFPDEFKQIVELSRQLFLPSECSLHCLDLSKTKLMTAIDWKRIHVYGFIPLFHAVGLPDDFINAYTNFVQLTIAIEIGPVSKNKIIELSKAAEIFIGYHSKDGPFKTRMFITPKTHSILHMIEYLLSFGPARNYSAYCFESKLGELKKFANDAKRNFVNSTANSITILLLLYT